jgi:hypothetical protein|uniref:Uncharacterized protein n=1 Tax=Populus trichocarpa TaxID=3694 RepID=A0A3N7F6N7_POPTR
MFWIISCLSFGAFQISECSCFHGGFCLVSCLINPFILMFNSLCLTLDLIVFETTNKLISGGSNQETHCFWHNNLPSAANPIL